MSTVKKLLLFIAVGSFFSTVEEFLTVVVLRRDIPAYVFTLLILFPTFLMAVFFSSKLLDRLSSSDPMRDLVHLIVYGGVGLMIEWFLIGLSPWSNPSANPFGMAIFQIGMISFWATVSFAPRLFLGHDKLNARTRNQILGFYIPYFVIVYTVSVSVPAQLRFGTVIPLVILGYLVLDVFYLRYFLHAFRSNLLHTTE
jgi:hypothetical protein